MAPRYLRNLEQSQFSFLHVSDKSASNNLHCERNHSSSVRNDVPEAA